MARPAFGFDGGEGDGGEFGDEGGLAGGDDAVGHEQAGGGAAGVGIDGLAGLTLGDQGFRSGFPAAGKVGSDL